MHGVLRNIPRLQEGCSVIFSQNTTKKELYAFNYEVILSKRKLKDPIQLRKEKIQMINFPRDSPPTLHTTHTQLREAESYFQKLACNTSYNANLVDDPCLAYHK